MSKRAPSRLLYGPLFVLLAIVILHYLFWHRVWFGRELDDRKLSEYLEQEDSRKVQHALTEWVRRMEGGDGEAKRWRRSISKLAESSQNEIRIAAAWAMGHDPRSELFHETLLGLLRDPEPMVRRNAALALVRLDDPTGISELRDMLRPYTVRAPTSGPVLNRTELGQQVGHGTILAAIRNHHEPFPVISPVPGRVESLRAEGSRVEEGEVVAVLSPDPAHAWESLRALYLVGEGEDLDLIEPFRNDPRYGELIARQASLTYEAIRRRSAANGARGDGRGGAY